MLALTRKSSQSIVLQDQDGEQIAKIIVQEIGKNKVKLLFEAEKEIVILREELLNES